MHLMVAPFVETEPYHITETKTGPGAPIGYANLLEQGWTSSGTKLLWL